MNGVEQGAFFPQPDVIDRIALALDIRPVMLFDDADPSSVAAGGFRVCDEEALAEDITDRLVQKLRPSFHADVAALIRSLAR